MRTDLAWVVRAFREVANSSCSVQVACRRRSKILESVRKYLRAVSLAVDYDYVITFLLISCFWSKVTFLPFSHALQLQIYCRTSALPTMDAVF